MLLLLVLMVTPYIYLSSTMRTMDAEKGVVTLGEIPERGVEIGGEWEFYRGLLTPGECESRAPEIIRVPSTWNSRIGSFGCATYRLTIHLPVSQRALSLKVNWIYSSYRLFVNGRNVATVGTPASQKEGYSPRIRPVVVPLDEGIQTAVLVFQVANWFNYEGGITNRIEAGFSDTVSSRRERSFVSSWFFAGGIFIMALFHFIIFIWGNRERSYLQFGLFCLVASLYSLILGEASFASIFAVPYAAVVKLMYMTIVLGPLLLACYFKSIFPWKKAEPVSFALHLMVLVFCVLCAVLNGPALVFIYRFMHPIMLLCLIFAFAVLIHGVIRSMNDAIPMLIAYSIAVIFIVNDILNAFQIVNTGSWGAFGIISFLWVKTAYLGISFASAYMKLENQSAELEIKVNERTALLVDYNQRLRRAKAEIEEADGFKKDFISSLSHEIRTPLNGIIGMIDVLEFKASGEEQLRHISTLKKASSDLLRIVNGSLDISRIHSGRFEVDVEEVRLADLMSKIEKITEYYAREKERDRIALLFYLSPEVPAVIYSDGVKLYQVMTNLLSNAVKFTAEGSVSADIVVRGFHDSRVVLRFSVSDTGAGIPEERKGEVFKSFARVHRGSSAPEGSGLGLSICKHLVELLGGTIRFDSAEGKGTSFWFDVEFDYSGRREEVRIERDTVLYGLPKTLRDYLVKVLGEWHASILIVDGSESLEDYVNEGLVDPAECVLFAARELSGNDAALFPRRAIIVPASDGAPEDGLSTVLSQRRLMEWFGVSARQEVAASAGAGKVSCRILAVEDDPTNREVLREYAAHSGVDIVFACDGAEGIRLARELDVDRIFMDIELPDMNGYEAADAIRADERASEKKPRTIFAVSAHSAQGFVKKGRESGMNGFLRKPFTYQEFMSAVTDAGVSDFAHGDSGDKRYWRRIFSVFAESTPGLLADMDRAARSGDAELVSKLAHRLKGSLGYFGDEALVAHIAHIEKSVRQWERAYTEVVIQDLTIRIEEFSRKFREEKGLWEE